MGRRFSSLVEAVQTRPARSKGPRISAEKGADHPIRIVVAALPQHHCYVELGLPSFPLFIGKPPSPIEVVNDFEGHVGNFFAVLRDAASLRRFVALHKRLAPLQPSVGRLAASLSLANDAVERAYTWFRLALALFSTGRAVAAEGLLPGTVPSHRIWSSREPALRDLYTLLATIDPALPDLHGRLFRVQYESRSTTEKVIGLYDAEDTLFWAYRPDETTVKQLEGVAGSVTIMGPDAKLPYCFQPRGSINGTTIWVKQ